MSAKYPKLFKNLYRVQSLYNLPVLKHVAYDFCLFKINYNLFYIYYNM